MTFHPPLPLLSLDDRFSSKKLSYKAFSFSDLFDEYFFMVVCILRYFDVLQMFQKWKRWTLLFCT